MAVTVVDKGGGVSLFEDLEFRVAALSHPEKGKGYRLDRERFDYLVVSVRYARVRLAETLRQLGNIQVGPDPLITKTSTNLPVLSQLGLLADHFNLIKLRKYQKTGKEVDNWYYPLTFACEVRKADLQTLRSTVISVFESTLEGLNGNLAFRGMSGTTEELAKAPGGKIKFREKWNDKFFPEDSKILDARAKGVEPTGDKRSAMLTALPKLKDDKIFLKQDAQARSDIYVDYTALKPDTLSLAERHKTKDGDPMFWTIIHEASHKYARTRDVNHPKSYDIVDRRPMHWLHAIRNAQHYMLYAGMNWDVEPEKGLTAWNYRLDRYIAEPHM